jgi:restriction system protein
MAGLVVLWQVAQQWPVWTGFGPASAAAGPALARVGRPGACRRARALFAGTSRFPGPHGVRTGDLFPGSRRRVVVQCKRMRPGRRVGDQDVQGVNGTYRHDHGAEFAVITTGGFTTAARASGPRYGIRLVDRDALERWAVLGEPLYRILLYPRCAVTEREAEPRILARKRVARVTLRQQRTNSPYWQVNWQPEGGTTGQIESVWFQGMKRSWPPACW